MKSRSYVLLTLGCLFSLGALVRFLPNAQAVAESAAAAPPSRDTPAAAPDRAGTDAAAKQVNEVCFTAETAALLAKDQERLKAQQAELQERELELLAREQELDRRAADLQAVEETLAERWDQMIEASNEDLEHLARMFGTMKPDQAASIFDRMDADFAAGFLRLMRSEQAGMILANMETDKAYAVSLKLASMNEDIRTSGTE